MRPAGSCVRNLSSRRLTVELASDRRDRGGARALVFAFAPSQVRIRPHGIATVYVAARALAPLGDPIEGLLAIRPRGSNAIHVPWLITVRPRHDELLVDPPIEQRVPSVGQRTGRALVPGRANRLGGPARAGRPARPPPPAKRRLAARYPRPAPRPPARTLRLRADRARRERRHARAGQVPAPADRVADADRGRPPRRSCRSRFGNPCAPAYTRRRKFPLFAADQGVTS